MTVGLQNRWAVLTLLFGIRVTMAFQYQSVATMSPILGEKFGVNLGEIGLLVSLYLVPGIFFAIPGGEFGQRFGDKRIVSYGLALMIAGGFVMAWSETWAWQVVGRLLAGIGGVLLNVVTAKMISDWFADRGTATAMAIFINSWPVGIALALIVLPPLIPVLGVAGAHTTSSALAAVGLLSISFLYNQPNHKSDGVASATWPCVPALQALLLSGWIWGLFNASSAMVFIYGPTLLVDKGWSLSAAGSTVSLVFWLRGLSIPIGGILADRLRRPEAVMNLGLFLFATMLCVAAGTEYLSQAFVVLAFISGMPTGPIMSLPVRVLTPEVRAVGMGIYYTMFYIIAVTAPIAAGYLATFADTSRATFYFGAAMLGVCVISHQLLRRYLLPISDQASMPTKLRA
jgi:MFS family permease